MEILQFLLSFLAKEYKDGKYKELFDLFERNSFDLKSVIKNADLNTIAPIVMDFMNSQNKSSPQSFGESYGLNPINNIANEKIVESLNSYLGE